MSLPPEDCPLPPRCAPRRVGRGAPLIGGGGGGTPIGGALGTAKKTRCKVLATKAVGDARQRHCLGHERQWERKTTAVSYRPLGPAAPRLLGRGFGRGRPALTDGGDGGSAAM